MKSFESSPVFSIPWPSHFISILDYFEALPHFWLCSHAFSLLIHLVFSLYNVTWIFPASLWFFVIIFFLFVCFILFLMVNYKKSIPYTTEKIKDSQTFPRTQLVLTIWYTFYLILYITMIKTRCIFYLILYISTMNILVFSSSINNLCIFYIIYDTTTINTLVHILANFVYKCIKVFSIII